MEIYRARRSYRHARGELSVSSNGIRLRGSTFQYLRESNFIQIGVENGQLVLKRSEDSNNLKLRLAAKGTVGEVGGKHLTQWLVERGFKKGQYRTIVNEDRILVNQELA